MSSTTPNLHLPFPELTDTADVPRDIKALADKLDAILGGGGGGGGSGTLPLANAPVLSVGQAGQVRAGRQLAVADFTSLGLGTPVGLFNLSGLTNLGSGGPLVNLGAVPFGAGINGLASTAAVFAGSTGQALYLDDSGSGPFAIKTGSWGCWHRTAKRGTQQFLLTKFGSAPLRSWSLDITTANVAQVQLSPDGTAFLPTVGVSDVCDDRWHFLVASWDGTRCNLYIDGALESVGSGMSPPQIFGGAAPLNIGGSGADASHASALSTYGRIDEAFVTADVLTEEQIRLLYCARLAHNLGVFPTAARLAVHRRRKGAALDVADFTTQPIRLHNFTGGALSDQGSGGVALTNNGGAVSVAGADGTPGGAFSFVAASSQSLSATDAGLPGGLTARSYGCWLKTTQQVAGTTVLHWGGVSPPGAQLIVTSAGQLQSASGADNFTGPFVSDGQWHQVVTVEDNTAGDGVRRKLYLDGRLVGGSTVLNSLTLSGNFRIGAIGGSGFLSGQVDGVFVCGYALTANDVAALWAKGSQELGASPKNEGDHVERMDATSLLVTFDTLDPQFTVDLGVVA